MIGSITIKACGREYEAALTARAQARLASEGAGVLPIIKDADGNSRVDLERVLYGLELAIRARNAEISEAEVDAIFDDIGLHGAQIAYFDAIVAGVPKHNHVHRLARAQKIAAEAGLKKERALADRLDGAVNSAVEKEIAESDKAIEDAIAELDASSASSSSSEGSAEGKPKAVARGTKGKGKKTGAGQN